MNKEREMDWELPKKFLQRSKDERRNREDKRVPERTEPLLAKASWALEDKVRELEKAHKEILKKLSDSAATEALIEHLYANPRKRHLEYFLSRDYKPVWLKGETDKVFFDIETLYLSDDEEIRRLYPTGSTHYIEKQRLGIAVSIADSGEVKCWEESEILEFVDHLLKFDEIVTFNGIEFDNYVLKGYLKDSKFQKLYNRSFDLMLLVQKDIGGRRSLESIARRRLGKGKFRFKKRGFNSKSIPRLIREGTPEKKQKVWKYCYIDTLLLMELYTDFGINLEKKVEFQRWQQERASSKLDEIIRQEVDRILLPENGDPENEWSRALPRYNFPRVTSQIEARYWEELDHLLKQVQDYEKKMPEDVLNAFIQVVEKGNGSSMRILDWEFSRKRKLLVKEKLLLPVPPSFRSGKRINKRALESLDCFRKFEEKKGFVSFAPLSLFTKTDFLTKTCRPLKEPEDRPVSARDFSFSLYGGYGGFCWKDEKGSSYGLFPRLSLPDVRDNDLIAQLKYVFCKYFTKRAQKYIKRQNWEEKFPPLTLDALVEKKVVERKDYPRSSKFNSFLKEKIKPEIKKLIRKYERELSTELTSALESHKGRCKEALSRFKSSLPEELRVKLKLEILLCDYSLLYADFLASKEVSQEDLDQIAKRAEDLRAKIKKGPIFKG